MPYDAREIANFFVDRAGETGLPLTHLSLQKILFFAHAWHLAKYNAPLIGQRFEAWKHGPVVRVVYDQLKVYKDKEISSRLTKIDVTTGIMSFARYDLNSNLMKFLENIFDYYAKFDAGKLVDLTHEEAGPWEKVWKSGLDGAVVGMYIPDESIRLWILREGGRGSLIRH
ncbi:Panacea domain-containing protein [Neomesorhizobium albiziae]|uniref:Panacea domain-containing protein n=1 Tax=Neomesorhizobium albiziae TaxID=335020 RepID=UPI00165F2E43|nr:type II toxin-antitoxin system antitoxin SocA domain-containing protein [Mesorhizobium albiziae]GLS29485.1 hypothetical protein GCM10007937_11930 [Mesorhizobium albiziae]